MKKVLGLLLFSMTLCFAMESGIDQEVEKSVEPIKAIYGVLVLDSNEDIMYSPYLQFGIKQMFGLTFNESDPMVRIKTFEGNGSSEDAIHLPDNKWWFEFPEYLPLSLLIDKKEGDKLIFIDSSKTKIIFTLKQNLDTENDVFENRLKVLISKFKEQPNWHIFDKEELIEKRIITRCRKNKYKHGLNGYKFN